MDEHWAVVMEGVPLACRARRAATGAAATDRARDRYLSLVERERIVTLRQPGHGVKEIAKDMKRTPTTISRELRRNLAASTIAAALTSCPGLRSPAGDTWRPEFASAATMPTPLHSDPGAGPLVAGP